MSAIVITSAHYLTRIGTDNELPKDRKHCILLLRWRWEREWKKAEEAGDTETLSYLSKQREYWDCL